MERVSEARLQNVNRLELRSRLPIYVRWLAAVLFAVGLAVVTVSFFRSRQPEFRMKGFPASLSKDVIATVADYERREAENGVVKYFIKADKATTFSDNHQELENVYLQVFSPDGEKFDQVSAAKAVYVPEANANFTAYFAGGVTVETRDALKVKSEQVTYKKAVEVVSADEAVAFERENVQGSSFGASLDVAAKRLELLKDVAITIADGSNAGRQRATLASGSASYDQSNEVVEVRDGITASVFPTNSNPRKIDVSARRAVAYLRAADAGLDVRQLELFDNVKIDSAVPGENPSNISSGYARYDKDSDAFDAKTDVVITTVADDRPTVARGASAVYQQQQGKIDIVDGEISQPQALVRGKTIAAELFSNRQLRSAAARGSAYARQEQTEKVTEVSADELNVIFLPGQILSVANAVGRASAVVTPVNSLQYSRASFTSPKAISVNFAGAGLLSKVEADGRAVIQLDAPAGNAQAAAKRLTADAIKSTYFPDGTNLERAEAVGNAELIVDPSVSSAATYKTTITAPRFDCAFFPTGNNAKSCTAAVNTRTERQPKVASPERDVQVLVAERLDATFSESSRDIDTLNASGGAKFTEADRNAVAEQFTFSNGDGRVRMSEGEPAVWDSTARAKASLIIWDTRGQKTFLSGGVSTTYYSQKQTGSAAPFGNADKPVFLTAADAEIDNRGKVAVYSGNARAWQDNNFVRGDRLTISQSDGTFQADGSVQSLLYDAKRNESGRESRVPVFASSNRLFYSRDTRVLTYNENVDIRQASDRITGGVAKVYLAEGGEVSRTEMEDNVVITQPNRRAAADYASYTQADESVVLRGNPARVDDAENGSSQAERLTIYLKSNRVEAEGKSRQNASGRARSVYKIKGK